MRHRTLIISMAAAVIYVAGLPATVLAQRGRAPVQLPDGDAKAMVEAVCVACHRLDFIPNSVGYTHEGWQELLDSMIILRGEPGEAMVSYLSTHLPPKPDSAPVLNPGPV